MKNITLFFSLLLLASCNDALRNRAGKCISSNNRSVLCSNSNALKGETFRKKYIAEISSPIIVGQSQIVIKENAEDTDHDQELICDLEISANKQFTYSIENKKLILKDGISTLRFDRISDNGTDELIGTWAMQDRTENTLIVTEVVFKDLEEIRIRKTCNLK